MPRDLQSKDVAWYRFTTTPGKVYGPRDMAFVWKTYWGNTTCEVACAGPDGQPMEPWFPATQLRSRLKSQAVQPKQLKRLRELGVAFDEATIDKIEALELIERAELQQPASDNELAEAAALGATVAPGMSRAQLNRAMAPFLEAEAEAEEEAERIAMNADWVARLRKRGVTVADDIDDESLRRAMDAVDDLDFAEEEARAIGLQSARATTPTAPEELPRVTEATRRMTALAEELNQEFLVEMLQLKRPPSKKLMASLYAGLRAQLAARPDFGGKEAKVWFLSEAAKLLDIALTIEDNTNRSKAARKPTPSPSSWSGARWALIFVGVVVLLRMCAN